ncbi:uncharacterized protein [Lolium perenne]|uniref:uncharacterized protein n=1 Tax=Lolium perenne TaxID=4522 RepID=UPI003A99BCD1
MNEIMAPMLRKFVLVFVDDILIYSKTLEDHAQHLQQVLAVLEQQGLKVKKSKCAFAKKEIVYLGHIISAQGVSTDKSKVAPIIKWQPPANKGAQYVWNSEKEAAFQALKSALVTALVLALPDFSKTFIVETDACGKGVGAVLIQDNHPLVFIIKALGPRHKGLSTYEKECLAILMAVDKWRSYLQHARHPETDGQTERVNQCLEGFLRCFVSSCQTQWAQWVPLAEFWYNTMIHSTLGKTPFEVLYGHTPKHFGVDVVDSCQIPDLHQWLKDRATMQQLLHQHLERQQQRMKSQADKKRTERHFEVGAMVYLRLQPYVQTSVATQGTHKLAFRFYGPFQVIEKVGKMACKLALPLSSKIHHVIHVSQLKKAVSSIVPVQDQLPEPYCEEVVPDMVLGSRWCHRDSVLVRQVKVRWQWPSEALATWEDEEELKIKYPIVQLGDKLDLKERVMSWTKGMT